MTLLQSLIGEPPITGSVPLGRRTSKEIIAILLDNCSNSDKEHCSGLERLFYNPWKSRAEGGYKLSIANVFKSPLYSSACKKHFAATHVYMSAVLLHQGEFLTEEIILAHVEEPEGYVIDRDYLNALLGSSHLSERLAEAIFKEVDYRETRRSLNLLPDAIITSRVISSWLAKASYEERHRGARNNVAFAALRIKRAYPEYEGFPDEWVLKVFCEG